MRNSKESSRDKGEKNSKNAVASKAASKNGAVKVVDVELKSKSKGRGTAAAALAKLKRPNAKNKLREAKVSRAARVDTRERAKVKPHKLVQEEASTPSPIIAVPTEKLLRPFRKAAEENRVQAKKTARDRSKKGGFLAKPIKKGKRYLVDLRVHSPGTVGYFSNGGIEPGPALIRLAQVKGLHMMGLTEYYDATYIDRVRVSVSPESGLIILPSVMLCCEVGGCREVPILVVLPDTADSSDVYRLLEDLQVPKSAYGRRDFCLTTPFANVLETIERHGGIAIPTRVDKTPYRQLAISELVESYGIHAFDLAHPDSPDLFRDRWPNGGFTFFSFSSANALGQIGNRVGKVTLAQLGFEGIKEIVQRRSPAAVADYKG